MVTATQALAMLALLLVAGPVAHGANVRTDGDSDDAATAPSNETAASANNALSGIWNSPVSASMTDEERRIDSAARALFNSWRASFLGSPSPESGDSGSSSSSSGAGWNGDWDISDATEDEKKRMFRTGLIFATVLFVGMAFFKYLVLNKVLSNEYLKKSVGRLFAEATNMYILGSLGTFFSILYFNHQSTAGLYWALFVFVTVFVVSGMLLLFYVRNVTRKLATHEHDSWKRRVDNKTQDLQGIYNNLRDRFAASACNGSHPNSGHPELNFADYLSRRVAAAAESLLQLTAMQCVHLLLAFCVVCLALLLPVGVQIGIAQATVWLCTIVAFFTHRVLYAGVRNLTPGSRGDGTDKDKFPPLLQKYQQADSAGDRPNPTYGGSRRSMCFGSDFDQQTSLCCGRNGVSYTMAMQRSLLVLSCFSLTCNIILSRLKSLDGGADVGILISAFIAANITIHLLGHMLLDYATITSVEFMRDGDILSESITQSRRAQSSWARGVRYMLLRQGLESMEPGQRSEVKQQLSRQLAACRLQVLNGVKTFNKGAESLKETQLRALLRWLNLDVPADVPLEKIAQLELVDKQGNESRAEMQALNLVAATLEVNTSDSEIVKAALLHRLQDKLTLSYMYTRFQDGPHQLEPKLPDLDSTIAQLLDTKLKFKQQITADDVKRKLEEQQGAGQVQSRLAFVDHIRSGQIPELELAQSPLSPLHYADVESMLTMANDTDTDVYKQLRRNCKPTCNYSLLLVERASEIFAHQSSASTVAADGETMAFSLSTLGRALHAVAAGQPPVGFPQAPRSGALGATKGVDP